MYKDIENIIYDYKTDIELFDKHKMKYKKIMNDIIKFKFKRYTVNFSCREISKLFFILFFYQIIIHFIIS